MANGSEALPSLQEENGESLAGLGGKDVLSMSLNSLHRARNLMLKDGLSSYSILSRKSTSSVPMSVKGRHVFTLSGISSSSSSSVQASHLTRVQSHTF